MSTSLHISRSALRILTINLAAVVLIGSARAAVLINEVDSDQTGTDAAEFVELFNTDSVNPASLDGHVLVFYNGATDVSYLAIDLDGLTIPAGGFVALGNAAVPNVAGAAYQWPGNTLQNGADAVALYPGDATGFPNETAVTTTNLVDAVVYDTSDADDTGLALRITK